MGRALTIFFGLLAFLLLAWVCLNHHGVGIQKEVGANAKAALVAGGFGFARATAEGQTVILRGTAETPAAREAAERAVLAATGVVDVDNQIALLTDVPPPGPDSRPVLVEQPAEPEPVPTLATLQVALRGDNKSALVTGLAMSASLDPRVQAALPDWQVSSELSPTATQAVAPDVLERALTQVLPALSGAETAQLNIDEQGIRVDARLASFADRTQLQSRLDALSGADETLEQQLSWMLDSPSPTVERCQQAFDDLLGKDSIMFTTNRAEIRPGSIGLLDKLVDVASDCNVTIEIEGHTDSRGTLELNNALSQARADTVRTYLTDNGVDGSQISAKGFGPSKPIANNNTVNGRQANRRIEFRVQRSEP